jgi:hypothetical protein
MASALRDRPRPSPGRPAGRSAAIVRRLRGLAPRQRALLALALLLLTLVPVAVSLARPAVRWSELVVTPAPAALTPRGSASEQMGRLLRDRSFRARVADERDSTWFVLESRLDDVDVAAVAGDPSRARVRVPARTRAEALGVARSVAAVITAQGRAAPKMLAVARARLREIAEALGDRPAPARRRQLLTERRFIGVAIGNLVALEVVEPPSLPSRTTTEALIEQLDESGAPRPSPLWAGLAGLLLGLALCCLWLARPSDERAGRDAWPRG